MNNIKKVLYIYSEIFFTDRFVLGLVIAGITFLDFKTGFFGVLTLVSAYLFHSFVFDRFGIIEPHYFYNPLLVGLSIGAHYPLTLPILFLALLAGILTIILTIVLGHALRQIFGLSALSLPFVIVSLTVYMILPIFSKQMTLYSFQPENYISFHLPLGLGGYFQSLAGIFFSTDPWAGACIALALLYHSRIILLLSLIGYYSGFFYYEFMDSRYLTLVSNPNLFNLVLTAVAAGGVYLVPSAQTYLVTVIISLLTYLVLAGCESFLGLFNLPVLTLPFNLVLLCLIYYLRLIPSKLKIYTFHNTPEENLDFFLNFATRFRTDLPSFSLPFSGSWFVSQAFDDDITHKGLWKYGVDFVMVNDQNEQWVGNPKLLDSYLAYAKPVFAPAAGTIVLVVNDIADNAIGSVNRENNWGNSVIIYVIAGYYIKISHLKKGSITSKVGAVVERGEIIAACGNSGYSPCPHIHIQAMSGLEDNSPTLEFRFEQAVASGGRFYHKWNPQKGQRVAALVPTTKKKKIFELLLKDSFDYLVSVKKNGVQLVEKRERIEVEMDPSGAVYMRNGKSRLYFDLVNNFFRFYRYAGPKNNILRYLFLAMPSYPVSDERIWWKDQLPIGIGFKVWWSGLILFLTSFYRNFARNESRLSVLDNYNFESSGSAYLLRWLIDSFECSVKIHREKFIDSIRIL